MNGMLDPSAPIDEVLEVFCLRAVKAEEIQYSVLCVAN